MMRAPGCRCVVEGSIAIAEVFVCVLQVLVFKKSECWSAHVVERNPCKLQQTCRMKGVASPCEAKGRSFAK
jgi:hypothetical protein